MVGRPFAKGQSGNPSGRPKAIAELRDLARQHTPAAIEALVAALGNPRERVSAATELLNRAWGKAAPLNEDGNGPAEQIIRVISGVPRPDASND